MTDGGGLVPFRADQPRTVAERLTVDFYAWEKRGRGWDLWPYPVQLEPPFRPFLGHFGSFQPVPDDARKPTFLSGIFDRIHSRFSGRQQQTLLQVASPEPEPEPAVFWDETGIIEMRVSLPSHVKVPPEIAERLLLSLSYCAHPLSFEILGLPHAIIVQVSARESDANRVEKQLQAHFPDVSLDSTEDFLRTRWRTNLQRVIVNFGLSEEFTRPLRAFSSLDPDPLIAVTGALSDVADGEFALLQVLFEATRSRWSDSILRAVTDFDGHSFFADAPEMLSLARQKLERPLFAATVRIAAESAEPSRARELVRAMGAALTPLANPGSNELIPLSNREYDFDLHEEDLLLRRTHRSGMILKQRGADLTRPSAFGIGSDREVLKGKPENQSGSPDRARTPIRLRREHSPETNGACNREHRAEAPPHARRWRDGHRQIQPAPEPCYAGYFSRQWRGCDSTRTETWSRRF